MGNANAHIDVPRGNLQRHYTSQYTGKADEHKPNESNEQQCACGVSVGALVCVWCARVYACRLARIRQKRGEARNSVSRVSFLSLVSCTCEWVDTIMRKQKFL